MGKQRSGDRGASLVELALALPLLVMLLVGMVSAGIAYNNQLALTHAAREGGRYAATLPLTNFSSTNDWLDAVRSQTIQDATGSLDLGVPGRFVCVAYVHPGPGDTASSTIQGSSSPTYSSVPCIQNDGRPADERRVQVVVRRDTEFSVVFFSSTLTLDAEAVNRFEAALDS